MMDAIKLFLFFVDVFLKLKSLRINVSFFQYPFIKS